MAGPDIAHLRWNSPWSSAFDRAVASVWKPYSYGRLPARFCSCRREELVRVPDFLLHYSPDFDFVGRSAAKLEAARFSHRALELLCVVSGDDVNDQPNQSLRRFSAREERHASALILRQLRRYGWYFFSSRKDKSHWILDFEIRIEYSPRSPGMVLAMGGVGSLK